MSQTVVQVSRRLAKTQLSGPVKTNTGAVAPSNARRSGCRPCRARWVGRGMEDSRDDDRQNQSQNRRPTTTGSHTPRDEVETRSLAAAFAAGRGCAPASAGPRSGRITRGAAAGAPQHVIINAVRMRAVTGRPALAKPWNHPANAHPANARPMLCTAEKAVQPQESVRRMCCAACRTHTPRWGQDRGNDPESRRHRPASCAWGVYVSQTR